jgi:hypothetical protein
MHRDPEGRPLPGPVTGRAATPSTVVLRDFCPSRYRAAFTATRRLRTLQQRSWSGAVLDLDDVQRGRVRARLDAVGALARTLATLDGRSATRLEKARSKRPLTKNAF